MQLKKEKLINENKLKNLHSTGLTMNFDKHFIRYGTFCLPRIDALVDFKRHIFEVNNAFNP